MMVQLSLGVIRLYAPSELIWRPILPPQQVVFFTILLVALAAFAYGRSFRRHRIASLFLLLMRWAGIAILSLILLGPSATPPSENEYLKSELTLMLDCSESMLSADCASRTRINFASERWLNEKVLRRLKGLTRTRLVGFAEEIDAIYIDEIEDPKTLVRPGKRTFLADCLQDVLLRRRRSGASGVLLLTDGHDSEHYAFDAIGDLAQESGIPVHTVAFGDVSAGKDLSILALPSQDYLLPDEPGSIVVKLYQIGMPQAKSVLRVQGKNSNREFAIDFAGQAELEVAVPVQGTEPGEYEFRVSLDKVDGEAESANNATTVYTTVEERRIRVLVLEGQPFWDSKFLAQSLRKDDRLELVQITQVAPQNRETLVSRSDANLIRLPDSVEGWSEYDVVVLGKRVEHLLTPEDAARLRDFVVDQGGHLVFARGQAYSAEAPNALVNAFGPVEPVLWQGNVLDLGEADLDVEALGLETTWLASSKVTFDTPGVLQELGSLASVDLVRRIKPATKTILQSRGQGERNPLLVLMPAGRGTVVALLGSGSWRWSLRAPASDELLGFYDTFWSNLMRWLVMGGDFQPGQQASLKVSQQAARVQDGITVDVAFKDATSAASEWRLVLRDPAGQERQLAMSPMPGRTPRFRAQLEPPVGAYELRLETPMLQPQTQSRRFSIYDVNPERLDASAWPERLRQLSERSGGVHFAVDDVEGFIKIVERAGIANQIPLEPEYVWDQWPFLFGLLFWIGSEWLLRRAAGLL